MNGAESLLRTLVGSGVEVCFGNPGTSEMHFVAALDRVEGMRAVLGLFEGAVTGMADGYGRIQSPPAPRLPVRTGRSCVYKATVERCTRCRRYGRRPENPSMSRR
jgi:glyoxylate carboligase